MKKNMILAACAAVLILAAAADSAWAYFTTYAQAKGGYALELGDETEVHEDPPTSWTKHVVITSDEDSKPVYIRVKAFCGSRYELVYSDAAGKWTPREDGYYYYSDIVEGGGSTDELQILIKNVPKDTEDTDSFNVAVIYETTPVHYKDDGSPYADWTLRLDSKKVEGGK